MSLPVNETLKVLVVGQSFQHEDGGGVTISNLFKNWNKDNIFSLIYTERNIDPTYCRSVYILGYKNRHPFIFWPFIKRRNKEKILSGEQIERDEVKTDDAFLNYSDEKKKSEFRNWMLYLSKLLRIPIYYRKYSFSKNLKSWLKNTNPQIIYAHYSDYASMKFILQIKRLLKIPLVIHILDDWISIAEPKTYHPLLFPLNVLEHVWANKSLNYFLKLIKLSSARIAISKAMAEEYFQRYGSNFEWIHNCADLSGWDNIEVSGIKKNDKFVIGYFGTITLKNLENFQIICSALSEINVTCVELRIFSNDESLLRSIRKEFNFVKVFKQLNKEQYYKQLKNCSLLYLPLGFSEGSLKYTRFSIPTKLVEYMVSKTPILVHAPHETALYHLCAENECSFLSSEIEKFKLKVTLEEIVRNTALRKKLALKAYQTVFKLFNSSEVICKFQKIMQDAYSIGEIIEK